MERGAKISISYLVEYKAEEKKYLLQLLKRLKRQFDKCNQLSDSYPHIMLVSTVT